MVSKLTDKLVNLIVDLAAIGYRHADVAEVISVDKSTIFKWQKIALNALKKDQSQWTDHERRCVIVRDAMKKGEFIALVDARRKIEDSDSWTAAAWLLERRLPKLYAKKIQFDPDELDKYLRRNFSEDTVNSIYTVMENDATIEKERHKDDSNGNKSKMENDSSKSSAPKRNAPDPKRGAALEAGYSTLPGSTFQSPQQRASKLEGVDN